MYTCLYTRVVYTRWCTSHTRVSLGGVYLPYPGITRVYHGGYTPLLPGCTMLGIHLFYCTREACWVYYIPPCYRTREACWVYYTLLFPYPGGMLGVLSPPFLAHNEAQSGVYYPCSWPITRRRVVHSPCFWPITRRRVALIPPVSGP